VLRVRGPHRQAGAVLRLGGPPTSKVLGQWLAGLDPSVPQVAVERSGAWFDPDRTALVVLAAEPGALCRVLAAEARGEEPRHGGGSLDVAVDGWDPTPHGWLEAWRAADVAAEDAIVEVLTGEDGPTEPGTARAVAAAAPYGGALVVSSSMPVRDLEWFAGSLPGVSVHANRGANGIDGVVSTAVGVALAGAPTIALVGDVALLHDTNALLGLSGRGVDLCVVVVHNDGGAIFSFLPQATGLPEARFEQLFGTPHGVDLTALAVAHDLPVMTSMDDGSTEVAVRAALAAGGVHLVVVRTDREANLALHGRLHEATGAAVTRALAPPS